MIVLYYKRGRKGPKPLFLLLFSFRPFGFVFLLRLNYQADGGDERKKRFRKVFDDLTYGFIHLLFSPFYG